MVQKAAQVGQIYVKHESEMKFWSRLFLNFGFCAIYTNPEESFKKYSITSKILVKQSFLEVSMNKKFSYKQTCAIYRLSHKIQIFFLPFNILISFQNALQYCKTPIIFFFIYKLFYLMVKSAFKSSNLLPNVLQKKG